MNYYQHNIGDYRRDTSHLSLLEHGIYRQLLDWYYLDEKPIPEETQVVFRRLSARTQEEQNAVEIILKEFFMLTNKGWEQLRCNMEIVAYQAKAETNRVNGKLGGRPKKTQSVSSGLANEKQSESENNLNHKPLTINQYKEPKGSMSGKPDDAKAKQISIPKTNAVEVLQFLNTKASRNYRPTDVNLQLILARLKEGYGVQDCKSVIAKKCREWGADDKMKEYLRPATLFNREKFNQYIGEIVEVPNE